MNYRFRRHRDYHDRSAPYCDSDRTLVRCDPPISWPERPSHPLSNFPGIAMFWPMPLIIPMMPSLGGWGAMRSGSEGPYYSDRRPDVNQYRCYEPRYRRSEQYCERCRYYECRCASPSPSVELIVILSNESKPNNLNYNISIVHEEYIDSYALPKVKPFGVGRKDSNNKITASAYVHVYQHIVKINVYIDTANAPPSTSTAEIVDAGDDNMTKESAYLKLHIY